MATNKTPGNQKPPDRLELTAQMDITAGADAGDGKPALPRFSMVAYTGGPMRVAGWRYPVVVDLAGLAVPRQNAPIRESHGARIGHAESIRVEAGTLVAAGVISCTGQVAREVVADAKNGFPWQASIGASVDQFEFIKENQSALVNGRDFAGPLNVVRKATLGEISFVDLGADGNTSANVAASAKEKQLMDGNDTITQDTTATVEGQEAPKVEAKAQAGTDAPAPSIQASADPIADMRARAAAEQTRIVAVRKVCGDQHAEIAAKAIAEGVSLYVSPADTFHIVGRLYALGVKGNHA